MGARRLGAGGALAPPLPVEHKDDVICSRTTKHPLARAIYPLIWSKTSQKKTRRKMVWTVGGFALSVFFLRAPIRKGEDAQKWRAPKARAEFFQSPHFLGRSYAYVRRNS